MFRKSLAALFIAAIVAVPSASAGLFENVYRGLGYLATPSGFPVFPTGDGGLANGARNGRVRVIPDRLGNGYSLEFDRAFGPDTRGRPETFDLGALDLTLNGNVQATASYTSRGFLIGNADFIANNLQYQLRGRSGAQNAEIRGTMNIQNSVEVNQFGFYTMTMNVSNTNSQLLLDGVLVEDDQPTNFDIGPISVEGNIFIDGLAALISSSGGDASELEGIFGASPSDRINDAIQAALASQNIEPLVTPDGQINVQAAKTPNAVLAHMLAADNMPNLLTDSSTPGDLNGPQIVPEPSSALLLAAAGLLALRRR